MIWRTDKPTERIIVAKLSYEFCGSRDRYAILHKVFPSKPSQYEHYEEDFEEIPYSAIEKWASLKEDDVIGDLENAAKEYEFNNVKADELNPPTKSMTIKIGSLRDAFMMGAQWQVTHAFTHHEEHESLIEAVVHEMEDKGDVDHFIRCGIDKIAQEYAELGAKWQRKQFEKYESFSTNIPEIEQQIGYNRGVISTRSFFLKDAISGFIVRNKEGELKFFSVKPERCIESGVNDWVVFGGACVSVSLGFSKMYPEVTWESEPVKVKLIIKRNDD